LQTEVLTSDQAVHDVMAKTAMKNRRAIYRDNPTLDKETPLNRKELWFDPKPFLKSRSQSTRVRLFLNNSN